MKQKKNACTHLSQLKQLIEMNFPKLYRNRRTERRYGKLQTRHFGIHYQSG